MNEVKKKVFVGMSGGVDSSVSAFLLKKAGYDVTGVFLKVWQPDFFACTWKDDRRDAMRVAAQLEIPFLTLNAEDEYKKGVVDYMISEYQNGRTPNPDVMCNNTVKFGVFYKKAMEMGADFIATGHYAQIIKKDDGTSELGVSVDTEKDQTYFLWNISKEALQKTLFPVGNLHKKQVRTIAREAGLFTSEKKDSQGLCFIGKVSMKDFLSHYADMKKGDVINPEGEVIGTHDGALVYTIGQRHGFHIEKKGTDDVPLYVIERDVEKNTIMVGAEVDIKEKFESNHIVLSKVNWLSEAPQLNSVYSARIRYRQPLQSMKIISLKNNVAEILFTENQKALSVGQSAVLYDGTKCLGGGIIEEIK